MTNGGFICQTIMIPGDFHNLKHHKKERKDDQQNEAHADHCLETRRIYPHRYLALNPKV
jgi:hypothetical protein